MCEVESFKRSSAVEVKCNEALTQTMVRLQDNVELLERVHSAEEEKQSRLRQNLVQVATIVEFTQRDLDILLNVSIYLPHGYRGKTIVRKLLIKTCY